MKSYFSKVRFNNGTLVKGGMSTVQRLSQKFAVQVCNMEDKAICDAIIKTAEENGFNYIYLLDKKFILEAINEKVERMKQGGEL